MVGRSIFLIERGKQGHRRQNGGGDGDTLGDCLGGVADGIQVGQGLAGLGFKPGHFADAVGVVDDGTEAVHGDIVAGQGNLADTAESYAVEDVQDLMFAGRPAR